MDHRFALAILSIVLLPQLRPDLHAQQPPAQADLVLRGARVVTMDPRQPEAEAVAVKGDRILAVGSAASIQQYIGPKTRLVQLEAGELVIPGLIEGHGHFVSLGLSRMQLDLRAAESWEEVVQQVARAAATQPAGTWILGRGWHQAKWRRVPQPNVEGYPVHDALSRVSPEHPVLLTHASGHAALANAKAMELAGIGPETPDPPGGKILRDPQGRPTGVLRETAQGLVQRALARWERQQSPQQRRARLLRAIELATEECLSKGITTFQDAGSSFATIDLFRSLAEEHRLGIRLWVMVRQDNDALALNLARYRMEQFGNGFLTVRAIKAMIDGALGSHGAWLLEPYDDLPGSTGLVVTPVSVLRRTAELAVQHDYQLCIHAIGDRANREVLDLYEEIFRRYPGSESRRWRIEHAQHLHPDDIPRFARLGVIASMQANHCTSDAPFVIQRLGYRRAAQGAYVWQSLLKTGAIVTNGTDAPVEDVDPIPCFYASVTRKLPSGVAFFPEQCMTRAQALQSYTIHNAYAGWEEDVKGSITPGKYADLVVLSKDILAVPEEELLAARVKMTILAGRIVYQGGR